MQIPLHTSSSAEAYIRHHEWRTVRLVGCPLHPAGGCSFARHGTYPRLTPRGMRIARWYCPQGHRTFSLLPDFLAARLPGLLDTIEDCVAAVGSAKSMEAAADRLRGPDTTLPSAVRWLRRRVRAVRAGLDAVARIVPYPPVGSRFVSNHPHGLIELRHSLAPAILADIPAPLGFLVATERSDHGSQQWVGPDATPDTRYHRAVNNRVGVSCNTIRQKPPQPHPPPRTCSVSGVPITASRTTPPQCTNNGYAVSEAIAPSKDWMNAPN